jgi:predicted nucleic acid-binding protein
VSGLVLLDSTVWIRDIRRRRDPRQAYFEWMAQDRLATCAVVFAEVLRGFINDSMRTRYDALMTSLQWLPCDDSVFREAALIAWDLDRRGAVLPLTDVVIAVLAMRHGAKVHTLDRHFLQIPGLSVELAES